MNTTQRAEALKIGIRAPELTEERAREILAAVDKPGFRESSGLSESAIVGLVDRVLELYAEGFPEMPDARAFLDNGIEALHTGDPLCDGGRQTNTWSDFYIGRFVAAGGISDLAELVRRAKHRDGSNAALGVAIEALHFLAAASSDDLVASALRRLSFDPANVTVGHFPFVKGPAGGRGERIAPTSSTASPVPPVQAPSAGIAETGDPRESLVSAMPAAEQQPALSPGAPVALDALGFRPVALHESAGVIVYGRPVSISDAVLLGEGLTAAVRSLLIPAEGFLWVDRTSDPKAGSFLLCHDPTLAAPTWQPIPAEEHAGASPVAAVVDQSPDGSAYAAKCFPRDGSAPQLLANTEDMYEAKRTAAEFVRGQLPKG